MARKTKAERQQEIDNATLQARMEGYNDGYRKGSEEALTLFKQKLLDSLGVRASISLE